MIVDLPIITVVTKMDYVPKNKILNVISNVRKEFDGIVLLFSAIDNRYNNEILRFLAGEDILT